MQTLESENVRDELTGVVPLDWIDLGTGRRGEAEGTGVAGGSVDAGLDGGGVEEFDGVAATRRQQRHWRIAKRTEFEFEMLVWGEVVLQG